jgi:hypothetical protein
MADVNEESVIASSYEYGKQIAVTRICQEQNLVSIPSFQSFLQ